jgi:hypothetical protein
MRELSESAIVTAVAQEAALRITREVIAELESMKETLSGDDSELESIWEEICVQVQHQESIFWETYDETVWGTVRGRVEDLPKYEREAIWLQTDVGFDWRFEETEDREAYPVSNDDIVNYLVRKLYSEAADWSNSRIDAYFARTSEKD